MPILHEVINGTKTKIYCQAIVCWTSIASLPRTIEVGLAKVGNQSKPLNYSLKKL